MADFTWTPNYVLSQRCRYNTLISTGEKGKKRRRSKRTNPDLFFTLMFERLTIAQADALWTFYQSKKGRGLTFTWQNPIQEDGINVTYTVAFDTDELTRDYFRHGRYRLQIGFEVIQ